MRRLAPAMMLLGLIALVLAASFVDACADATVYLVHGIPDAVVDVALDGVCIFEAAMFGDQAGPIDIPAGIHQVTIHLADPTDPCTGEVVVDAPVELVDGENVTAVAYLDEMCMPTAAKFTNDFSRTDPGKARVTLHHTACAPAIDIAVARDMDAPFEPVIQNFGNGDQVVHQLRPGEWYVWLAETGSPVPLAGPALVRLKPFVAYRVFAIGSIAQGNETVVVFEDNTK